MARIFDIFPDIRICCGIVNDLKSAAAIIATLSIVTNPAVSWICVRHSYMIKMACTFTSVQKHPEVVDISLENILSFGFGTDPHSGQSCLQSNQTRKHLMAELRASEMQNMSIYSYCVQYMGWITLLIDVILVVVSVTFLISIVKEGQSFATQFIITSLVDMIVTFVYTLMYIMACVVYNARFGMCDAVFAFIDFGVWFYFLLVVNSYRKSEKLNSNPGGRIPPQIHTN